jgi:two-component system, OmpR family, response regulator
MLEVLLVEDDEMIATLLCEVLEPLYKVTHTAEPLEALDFVKAQKFAIIILDLTLPQMDGLTLCKEIRKLSSAGIIISSARSGIDDKLIALQDGADDYLPKPYDPRELLARMSVLINRLGIVELKNAYTINEEESCIYYENSKIELTWAEYEIFTLLFRNPDAVISRATLANSMSAHRMESGADSINVLMARLRKKLPTPKVIVTLRGLGYKFSTDV